MDEMMFRLGSQARKPHSSVRLKPLQERASVSELSIPLASSQFH